MAQDELVIAHRIAGITFRVDADVSHLWPPHLDVSFQRFQVDNTNADVCFRIRRIDPVSSSLPPLTQEEAEIFSAFKISSDKYLHRPLLRSSVLRERLTSCLDHSEQTWVDAYQDTATILDYARCEMDIFYTDPNSKPLLEISYIQFPIFAQFLPAFSAAMIHSSGIIRNGVAALFLAPDEGGKTTTVRLSPNGIILSDDQVILRVENSLIMAHGTPWGLFTSGPQQARVGGLFVLEHAEKFELIPLSSADLLQFLWSQLPGYQFLLPKHLKIRLFDILTNISYQIPAFRLRFPKDYIDWDAIDAAMK